MESDTERLWSSMDLHNLYRDKYGTKFQRRNLIEEISSVFGHRILVLSCTGLANMLVFRSRASQLVHLVEETDTDCASLRSVAKQIVQEANSVAQDTSSYSSKIDELKPLPVANAVKHSYPCCHT